MKGGFTLIELSIALVIIGLLIGGVLVGQDLIETSKLRRIASDYEKYNSATHSFRVKYNCLAGDCSKATDFGFQNNGTGDGFIGYPNQNNNPTPSILIVPQEGYYLWQHLGAAGLIEGNYSGDGNFTCFGDNACNVAGVNVPVSSLGKNKYFISFYINNDAHFSWSLKRNFHVLVLGNNIGAFTNVFHNPSLTVAQQFMLDKKYDDAKPYSGNIFHQGTPVVSTGCATNSTADISADYLLSSSNDQCILIWRTTY